MEWVAIAIQVVGWIYFFAFWRGKVDTTLSNQQKRDKDLDAALDRRGQRSDALTDKVQVLIGRVDLMPNTLRTNFLDREAGLEAIRTSVEDRQKLYSELRRLEVLVAENAMKIARFEERRRSPR